MVDKNGIWGQQEADEIHPNSCSANLAKWMADFFPQGNVIDFGCGHGYYIAELQKAGFNCIGVEGYPLKNFLHPHIHVLDLSQPCNMNIIGSVISLEVGEHIPQASEQIFLDTVTKHCNGKLVFSWALPGQPGLGHINCQPQGYIVSEVERRGFKYLHEKTLEARAIIEDNCDWFRRTLLIFEKV